MPNEAEPGRQSGAAVDNISSPLDTVLQICSRYGAEVLPGTCGSARRDRWCRPTSSSTRHPLHLYEGGASGLPAPDREQILDEVRQETEQYVSDVIGKGGAAARVDVRVRAVPGPPAAMLIEQSRGADLLVVGHRGRGGFASATLGSVSLQCVLHATYPVTVVRPSPQPAEGN